MAKYRKKPVVIEAFQWNPESRPIDLPQWLWDYVGLSPETFNGETGCVLIKTLEGEMIAAPGDYIVRGIKGELYPCRADIFEATNELVE